MKMEEATDEERAHEKIDLEDFVNDADMERVTALIEDRSRRLLARGAKRRPRTRS
jgi:hypothetical protein